MDEFDGVVGLPFGVTDNPTALNPVRIDQDRRRQATRPQFARKGAFLVDQNFQVVDVDAGVVRHVDGRQGGAPVHRGQPAGVAMGQQIDRPVLFIPGIQELDEIETIAGISIMGRVAKITAQYETPLYVPVR